MPESSAPVTYTIFPQASPIYLPKSPGPPLDSIFSGAFSDPSSFSDPSQNQSNFTSNLPATSLPPHLQSHLHAHLQAHLQQNLHAHLQTYLQPVFIDPTEKEDHISNFEIQLMFAIPSEVKQGLGEEYGKEGGQKYSKFLLQ